MGFWLALLALCLPAAPAAADDANTVPPNLELHPSGDAREPLGINGGSLAFYETAEPDASWGYTESSAVSFECFVDGSPVRCSKSYYDGCCFAVVPLRSRVVCPRRTISFARSQCPSVRKPEPYVPEGRTPGLGPFTGWVPMPENVSDGAHRITVVASDEDGSDPTPPTVIAVVDRTRPAAPRIVAKPRKVSRDQTPRFRYVGVDERRLWDGYNDPFSARLQRLRPRGVPIDNANPFGDHLEWRGPHCRPRRCRELAWPAYSAESEGGTSFSIREHLQPGLYEFSVATTDMAENRSKRTRYRFRVLRPLHRPAR